MDLIGVLKTVMHYGIVSGKEQRKKSLGKYKDPVSYTHLTLPTILLV